MTNYFFACYTRKSVIDDETTSPARQRERIERAVPPEFARRWYEDLDISGRYEAPRRDWQRLLNDLADPHCAGVACESLDRIYRNRTEFGAFKARLEAAGKQLIIATMPGIDGRTAAGNLFLGITSEVAEFESRVASERVTAHIRHLVRNEGRHWGPNLFGTGRDPKTKHLIPSDHWYWYDPLDDTAWRYDDLPVPARAERRYYFDSLHELYRLYAPGEFSYQDMAMQMNLIGWRFWDRADYQTPLRWDRQMVRAVLENWRTYAGYDFAHEPILPVELCEQTGATVAARSDLRCSTSRAYTRHGHLYLLTGLLYCHRCGRRLTGKAVELKKGYRFRYFHTYGKGGCPEKEAPVKALENQVLQSLLQLAEQKPFFDQVRERIREALLQTVSEAEPGAAERLAKKQGELSRLIDAYQDGIISKEELAARRPALDGEIARLEKILTPPDLTTPSELEALLDEVISGLQYLADGEKMYQRDLIRSFFERLEVRDRRIVRATPKAWARRLLEVYQRTGKTRDLSTLKYQS